MHPITIFHLHTSYLHYYPLVLSHIFCDTKPWNPSWVLVMVPSNGTGACYGGWTFLGGSCIPKHDQVDTHLIYDSQKNVSVSKIGCPSSTWTKHCLQSFHTYFTYKTMGVGSHMWLFLSSYSTPSTIRKYSWDSVCLPMLRFYPTSLPDMHYKVSLLTPSFSSPIFPILHLYPSPTPPIYLHSSHILHKMI